jgi:hypothetical protein
MGVRVPPFAPDLSAVDGTEVFRSGFRLQADACISPQVRVPPSHQLLIISSRSACPIPAPEAAPTLQEPALPLRRFKVRQCDISCEQQGSLNGIDPGVDVPELVRDRNA